MGHLNFEKTQKWLEESQNFETRRIKQKILDNLTFINEKEFDKAIKYSTKLFLKEIKDKEYIVLFDKDPFCSKRWVFLKIRPLLVQKNNLNPLSYFFKSSNFKYWIYLIGGNNLIKKLIDDEIKHIVIFDDAMYTGSQVISSIETLIQSLRTHNYTLPVFYIVVGFSSNLAIKTINEKIKDIVEVKIFFSNIIKTNKEIFSYQELKLMSDIDIISLHKEIPLTYFFHKVPDGMSFPHKIKEIMDIPPKPYEKNTNYGEEEKKEFDAFSREIIK